MKNISLLIKQLLQDKNGHYSLREAVTVLFIIAILVSWIARQFFHQEIPEFMFYSFVSLVGAGCFGYSLEKKGPPDETPKPGN